MVFQVDVEVLGMGKSSSFIVNDADRRFTLLPSVSSISPTKGSLSGGTLLTISGQFLCIVTGNLGSTLVQKEEYNQHCMCH